MNVPNKGPVCSCWPEQKLVRCDLCKAAPEMLEALKESLRDWELLVEDPDAIHEWHVEATVARIEAIIAKINGQQEATQ